MPEDGFFDRIIADTRPVIEVDGERREMVTRLLKGLEMREAEGEIASAELRFENTAAHEGAGVNLAFEHEETDLMPLGAAVRVLVGPADDPTEIFRGRVSAIEFVAAEGAQPELVVHAEDALMPLRMIRRSRAFGEKAVRAIIEEIAQEVGLQAVVTGLDHAEVDRRQRNETDLGFLRRLLAVWDADAQVVGEELHASARDQVDRGEVTLALGGLLRSIRVVADLAHQREAVTVSGFDHLGGEDVQAETEEGALGPGAGKTGAEFLADLAQGRTEHIPPIGLRDRTEAQALANAAGRRRARRFVVAEGSAQGDGRIRVGTRLALERLGPRFSNTYYVTGARHRFDRIDGYRTDFTAECAFWGEV